MTSAAPPKSASRGVLTKRAAKAPAKAGANLAKNIHIMCTGVIPGGSQPGALTPASWRERERLWELIPRDPTRHMLMWGWSEAWAQKAAAGSSMIQAPASATG